MDSVGFEPTASCLQGKRSYQAELTAHSFLFYHAIACLGVGVPQFLLIFPFTPIGSPIPIIKRKGRELNPNPHSDSVG